MDWIWLIPLIALVVWILVNLMSIPQKPQQQQQQGRPGPQPPGANRGGPPRKEPTTDLDRFIEEAKRKRREVEQKRADRRPSPMHAPVHQAPPAPPPPPRPQRAPESAIPRVRPAPVPPPLPKPAPQPVASGPSTVPSLPPAPSRHAPPPPRPRRAEPETIIQAEEVRPALETIRAAQAAIPSMHNAAYLQQRRQVTVSDSAVARQTVEMLADPNSVRTAFILKEILDRPICMRRRGG